MAQGSETRRAFGATGHGTSPPGPCQGPVKSRVIVDVSASADALQIGLGNIGVTLTRTVGISGTTAAVCAVGGPENIARAYVFEA
jgi:hypothetical protein